MSQPLVLPKVIDSMLASFAPVFTRPSFQTFCQYVGALMLGEGRRTGAAIAAQQLGGEVPGRLCPAVLPRPVARRRPAGCPVGAPAPRAALAARHRGPAPPLGGYRR